MVRLCAYSASALPRMLRRPPARNVPGFQPQSARPGFSTEVFLLLRLGSLGRIDKGLQRVLQIEPVNGGQLLFACSAVVRRPMIIGLNICGCFFLVALIALAPSDAVSDRVVLQASFIRPSVAGCHCSASARTVRFNA